ncbi:MAG: hypothetical protein CL840_16970 [Crocinitomicaceae bacterium]|nr:hypothetical protein [Crocinitomicaceae bacterium]|tara:strand:- start:9576 stop:11135 length:1560 start_codon:yes stop_codon:yes gene_type:complete
MRFNIIAVTIVLLGTLVRVLFGLKFQYWNLAPDQIASELILNDLINSQLWSYAKIIHYPHEGGSILVSLLGLLFKPLFQFKSLVIVAFLLDTVSRYVQLVVVNRVFGKKAMLYFGFWTIVGVPLILPWAGLSFGLHSISSVFPFLFIYLIHRVHSSSKEFVADGIFLGLSAWFSYTNLIFVPIYIVFLLHSKTKLKNMLWVGLPLGVLVLFHVGIRVSFDTGFGLSKFSLGSIRGESFNFFEIESYARITKVYTEHLTQISLLENLGPISTKWVRIIWYWMGLLGIVLFIQRSIKGKSKLLIYPILVLAVYFALYAISPFYLEWPDFAHYINARHFTYIIPLFVAISIVGLANNQLPGVNLKKAVEYGLVILIFPCIFSAYVAYKKEPTKAILARPTGWVLATKFGHLPEELIRINSNHIYDEDEISIGIGWGTATNLFASLNDSTTEPKILKPKVALALKLLSQYQDQKALVFEGMQYAFSSEVTPRLDSNIFNHRIRPAWNEKSSGEKKGESIVVFL